MPIDIVDHIASAIEPDPTIAVDPVGERPFEFEPDTLYVWTDREERAPADGLQDVERFEILIVFVAENEGEEALQERDPDVSERLDVKREAYLSWIADRAATPMWDHLAGSADMDWLRSFEGRAVAVRASGYRFVEN